MFEDRDFGSWQITSEQADKISAGDIVEMTAFYNLHIERLRGMAYKYARTHNQNTEFYRYDPEEMLSQLYLDLRYLNWQNSLTLTMSIKQTSFAWSAYGGYAQRVAQGLPHSHKFAPWEWIPDNVAGDACKSGVEDGDSLFFSIQAPEEERPDYVLLESEYKFLTSSEICKRLEPVLTERSASILQLYLQGYTYSQIGEKLGLSDRGFLSNLIYKLTLQYEDVLKLLYTDRAFPLHLAHVVPPSYEHFAELEAGRKARRKARNADKRAQMGKPPRKPPRTFASEEERREARRATAREWARQKRAEQRKARESV